MDDNQPWEGLSFPNEHFFKVPNGFIEAMSHIDNLSELKIVLYVMRHTWGFQEFDKHKKITIDEFMRGRKMKDGSRMDSGTGLSNRAVIDGTEKAVRHGFLECETDKRDLGRVKKHYRLKIKDTDKPERKEEALISALRALSYEEYLQTPEWKERRKKALSYAKHRCQVCNSREDLNVHHRTYERLGEELPSDLTVLCHGCHGLFHHNRDLTD